MTSPSITRIRPADAENQVVTVEGGGGHYRRRPCAECPWRRSAAGSFPAEAFRHSAETAYDMATHTFACHQSGSRRPAVCAGFLLRGADHSLAVRLRRMRGEMCDVEDAGLELFDDYVEMAVANGVGPEDPALAPCRRRAER